MSPMVAGVDDYLELVEADGYLVMVGVDRNLVAVRVEGYLVMVGIDG
jgi:hypothetical protein